MDDLKIVLKKIWSVLDYDLVPSESVTIKPITFILIVFIIFVIQFSLRGLKRLLTRVTKFNEDFDEAKIYTVVQLLRYILYVFAFVFILNNIGFDINSLLIGSAAFLAALGLGLQPIFQDMVSGLIIFFEGVLHKGDILEVDNMVVQVEEINIRTSKVRNRDGNFMIIPNSKLTSNNVVNWSHQNELSRFMIQIGVAYGSDTELVKSLLIQAAKNHPESADHKGYEVWFSDFGDSALIFQLFFWARKSWNSEVFKSDIRFEIDKSFRENGIKIPFPQREISLTRNS